MFLRLPALLFLTVALFGASRPPVILVDGGYPNCSTAPVASRSAFGQLEQKLYANGYQTIFFRPCSVSASDGSPFAPIEELGEALGTLIEQTAAPQVDLILYSMGNLIARCYLSGKQKERGVFKPPLNPKVRKAVFIGGPHLGSPPVPFRNSQNIVLDSGSRFVWDLATWNQGSEDLRQVDAIAVIGNGGGTGDGAVPLTSGSISFAFPAERTRVLPACHSTLGCTPAVAYVNNDRHPTWLIVSSFLEGTDDWKMVGVPADQDPLLSGRGGILVGVKDASDNLIEANEVSALGLTLNKGLTDSTGLFYVDFASKDDYTLQASAPFPVPDKTITVIPGTFTTVTMKPGPLVARVQAVDSASQSPPMMAGSIISIYGERLADTPLEAEAPFPSVLGSTTVNLNDRPIPLISVSESQIQAQLPDDVTGFVRLTITNDKGAHGVNLILVEKQSVPER